MTDTNGLPKHPTGIPGLDTLTEGGLPLHRTTLVAGTSGSAKTVFAAQFLAAGIERFEEPGVFVTFEESPEDITRNLTSFGWPVHRWIEEGRWAFVDASTDASGDEEVLGAFDFTGLMASIEHQVQETGAKRIVLDSVGAIQNRFPTSQRVRRELLRLTRALRDLGVTAVITAERTHEYGPVSRLDVEEFVVDNVIILRNVLEAERCRRTIQILKFRGATHRQGEYPFIIQDAKGIVTLPVSTTELTQPSTDVRIPSGVEELDEMLGGGFYRDSIILVSGPTGTGKTLITTEFLQGAADNDEKALLFSFEESRDQFFRNADGWGKALREMEAEGRLRVVALYPESTSMEALLVRVGHEIKTFQPDRVAVDSLSALERVSTLKGFREFVIGVTSLFKTEQVAALFTAATDELTGGVSVSEGHISTMTDTVILLRYVELLGEMRRGLTVLKMRGSAHDKRIREFEVTSHGMVLKPAFRSVTGILTGVPTHISADEYDRLMAAVEEGGSP